MNFKIENIYLSGTKNAYSIKLKSFNQEINSEFRGLILNYKNTIIVEHQEDIILDLPNTWNMRSWDIEFSCGNEFFIVKEFNVTKCYYNLPDYDYCLGRNNAVFALEYYNSVFVLEKYTERSLLNEVNFYFKNVFKRKILIEKFIQL